MSPVHSSTVRYGNSRRLRTSSALAVSRSSSSYDCSGVRERHQLDLVELVLANQPAHVGAVRSGLAAEARRVGRVANRQRAAVENLAAVHVRQRHFGGRNQIQIPVAGDLEQVGLELREIAGSGQRRLVGQKRRRDLRVPVRARVQVEHEVDQRPLEARGARRSAPRTARRRSWCLARSR